MILAPLVEDLRPTRVEGSLDIEISGLQCDSRRVGPGDLFVSMPGATYDGREFISDAILRGAVAVVTDTLVAGCPVPIIQVESPRRALADLACAYYNNPALHLKIVGVTGTNGKTTVTHLAKWILDSGLQLCGLIGTIYHVVGNEKVVAERTTPESLEVQKLLWRMRSAGCRCVAMEVSSHALVQERVRGIEFDVAVFTNLTQDHLDYHLTMDAYFAAKARLFDQVRSGRHPGVAVINIDDRYGGILARDLAGRMRVVTYGVSAQADFRASAIRTDVKGTQFQLDAVGKSFLVRLPLIGHFNVLNALAALAAAHHCGVDLRTCVQMIANAPSVPGRMEIVPAQRTFRVIVDYAHTDDALVNAMQTLRALNPARLIVLFGCGGDRDRGKRRKMAAAVDAHADVAVLTSDNPRSEDPNQIIADTRIGFSRLTPIIVVDRREAIQTAVNLAGPRDIVLLAGKGHETYQEIGGVRHPFDDVAVARRAIEARPSDHMEAARRADERGERW